MGQTISPKARFQFTGQRKRQLKQDLEHITEEMYRRNKELAETNKTLSLLRAIDGIVLETHDSLEVACGKIADAIAQAANFPFVGIFIETTHDQGRLRLAGWSTKQAGPNRHLGSDKPMQLSSDIPWFTATNGGQIVALHNMPIADQAKMVGLSEAELQRVYRFLPLQSMYAVKVMARNRLVGLIVSGFIETAEYVQESDTVLLDRLSESIGLALDNKLLFEENQHVLRQLRITNAKLRELDNIKDDFISMASHQLRTPLTAVKGYLSMVIDGDAGEVAPPQAEMLKQAFNSAQRMVFLITDLLNVSRLKTGKFIIDAAPLDLSQVVAEEVDQLRDTAEAKHLTLSYRKPANFPQIMLDETKTRQVVMNFIDNAIYYTPEGGHVDVELVDNPQSVELRVVDDGIGVPKAEQHHLFTKFYRAANARKARPDGTGLGLFMAQKVVIAQGGSIIFSSKENQGSTFGFTFPKSRVAAPASSAT